VRFLCDQDVYATTVRLLRALGHDVATAAELGLAQAVDPFLLKTATEQDRLFVTRDRDFGSLVFVQGTSHGIIYLRGPFTALSAVHQELERVLLMYSEQELRRSFLVVEPGRHRIRRLP
jgi:predicted nuclease of predicted toxin-antitoxin system